MAITKNVQTAKKHTTAKQKKNLNTAVCAVGQVKKKERKSATSCNPMLPIIAALYLTKGDKKMNAAKICPLHEKKHYLLTKKECWHKVQIIDLGELKTLSTEITNKL